jgi:endonuclease/exonuclease/phosphatase family metal-dependent hydrolase
MSWNVWWRFGPDWRRRERGILATLEALRPDLVGLQEVWGAEDTTQAEVLGRELGMHPVFGAPSLPPPPDHPESADQVGIEVGVAVLSRWPVTHVRKHALPSRKAAPTVALDVTVAHPSGPMHVLAACVDWERDLAALHLAQTRALAALLADPSLDGPMPVLLTADLNAPPDTPQIRALTDVMVDTWVAAGGDAETGHTLSSANPLAPREAWQIDHRIDYVMARPGNPGGQLNVERAFLAGDPHAGSYPSDHYAVVADFRT